MPSDNTYGQREQMMPQGQHAKLPRKAPNASRGLLMPRSLSIQSLGGGATVHQSKQRQASQQSNAGGRMNTDMGSPDAQKAMSRQSSRYQEEHTNL